MIKIEPLLILLFYLCSCNNTDPQINYNGYLKKAIFLTGIDSNFNQTDTLASITINIPARLDTFYKWRNTSDCTPCGWVQYRFSDKTYPQFAESGFFWTKEPDSVYQLTIRHKPQRWYHDEKGFRQLEIRDSGALYSLINSVSYCEEHTVLRKEFLLIKKRGFYVAVIYTPCGYLTNKSSLSVAAITNLKSRWLEINGQYSGTDTTGFIESIYKSLMSIELNEL